MAANCDNADLVSQSKVIEDESEVEEEARSPPQA